MNKNPSIEEKTLGICALATWIFIAVFYGTKGVVKVLREKNMQKIIDNYGCIIEKYASYYDVDPLLVTAVILRESSGNPDSTNPYSSAKGLMQLLDGTAREMGVTNSFDPEQNIMGGTKYLSLQVHKFGDIQLGVAAYKAGSGTIEKYNNTIPQNDIGKTQDYVNKVMNSYSAVTSDVWQALVCQ